jgi:hypothetical protein
MGMILTRAAEGADLNVVAFDPRVPEAQRDAWFRGAGRALGALHSCRLRRAPRASRRADVEELHEHAGTVAAIDGAVARRYHDVLGLLRDDIAASATDDDHEVAAGHGAFRLDQLVVGRHGCELIDLDSLCEAPRGRDIGNLLAYLDWKALRRPDLALPVARARTLFAAGYADRRPPVDPGAVAVYRAAALLKIAGRRYRSLAVSEWPLVPALIERAASLLGGARPDE